MTVDSSLYSLNLAAGTYTAGEKYAMTLIKGPAVVRDGYGAAVMKRITTFSTTVSNVGMVSVQNSSWIDPVKNLVGSVASDQINTAFAQISPNLQRCANVQLQPNSSWTVIWECKTTMTIQSAIDVYCMIDIDYPSVAAVANPQEEDGTPCTIEYAATITDTVRGDPLNWQEFNVDLFKAGYRYLISSIVMGTGDNGTTQFGFIAISGAAGQAGLCQILPCSVRPLGAMRPYYDYSNIFVKGPMNIQIAVVDNTSGASAATEDVFIEMDCIRR